MEKTSTIIIAGAGGIARAVALILAEWSESVPHIFIGNRTLEKAQKVAEWMKHGVTKACKVEAFHLAEEGITKEMKQIFSNGDILLDCLPGSLAPRMAEFAKTYELHYVNLTEYVAETNTIIDMAHNTNTGFVLQSGLAPGYIDILAHGLFQYFIKTYQVEKVDTVELKVGALTDHAVAPHFYGFTWSPVGVATEYIKDCVVIREYKKVQVPALSEQAKLIINGRTYEEDLTSGGAADLPDALAGKVKTLDYKTLRHPGHYDWIKEQLKVIGNSENNIQELQSRMESTIPHIEDDQIIIYAAVEGKDHKGILRRKEIAKKVLPQYVGKHRLRAIQTTTAAPMVQAATYLLENKSKGIVLQSMIDPVNFLNGNFTVPVYGDVLFEDPS